MGSGSSSGTFRLAKDLDANKPDMYHGKSRFDKFREIPGTDYPVWCVAVAENSMILAAATADNQVHMWEMKRFELRVSLGAHKGVVWSVEFSQNELTLATAASDNTIRLWEVETGSPIGVLKSHTDWVRSLSFAPGQHLLLSGGQDSMLALWEYDNPLPLKKWKAHEGSVHAVSYSHADPSLAFSIGGDGSVALWDVKFGKLVGRFAGGDGGAVLCVSSHPFELNVVATGIEDGGVWLWLTDIDRPKETMLVQGHQHLRGHAQAVWALEFSSNGCLLASASADGSVRVWDVRSIDVPKLCSVFKAHESWVRCIRWTSTHRRTHEAVWQLISGGADGRIKLWDAPNRLQNMRSVELERMQASRDGHGQPPPAAVLTPVSAEPSAAGQGGALALPDEASSNRSTPTIARSTGGGAPLAITGGASPKGAAGPRTPDGTPKGAAGPQPPQVPEAQLPGPQTPKGSPKYAPPAR